MVLQMSASILLGRLLLAADFGIVNFSNIITGFVSRLNDLGVESAVLQRTNPTSRTVNTAFLLKLGTSAFLMALLWLLASPLASALGTPKAVPIIRLLSLTFLSTALSFAPIVWLRKTLRYDLIARTWVAGTFSGALCTILLALGGAGYWSIAIGQVVASAATLATAQWLRPTAFRLEFDTAECRRLLSFGGRVFLANVLVFACFNIDNFLIGLKLGAAALGVYGIAFNWATQMCSFVSGTVHSVLFPAFANLGNDRQKVGELYLTSLRRLGLFGAIGYGIFVLIAPEFLVLILGRGTDKWIAALPVLQILCVYGILRQLLEPLANVLLALGRADMMWRSAALVFAFELIGVGAVLWLGAGIVAVAWVILGAYAMQYLYYFAQLRHELGVPVGKVLRLMMPALVSVLILAGASAIWPFGPSWLWLLGKGALGGAGVLLLYAALGGKQDIQGAYRQIRLKITRQAVAT
jgi:teichuronic acid exporter